MTPRADLAALLEEALANICGEHGDPWFPAERAKIERVAAALREREPAEPQDCRHPNLTLVSAYRCDLCGVVDVVPEEHAAEVRRLLTTPAAAPPQGDETR